MPSGFTNRETEAQKGEGPRPEDPWKEIAELRSCALQALAWLTLKAVVPGRGLTHCLASQGTPFPPMGEDWQVSLGRETAAERHPSRGLEPGSLRGRTASAGGI